MMVALGGHTVMPVSQDARISRTAQILALRTFLTGRGIFEPLSRLRQRRQRNAVLWLGCSLRISHNDEPSVT